MRAALRRFRRRLESLLKRPRVRALLKLAGIAVIVLVAIAAIAIIGTILYAWSRSGFGAYKGPITEPENRAKTLWDWMDLLLVPIVLAGGALFFGWLERKADRERQARRAETERDIALDRQRENALQMYLDRMAELLLKEGLRTKPEDAEVRDVARPRTLTVLRGLDGGRKGSLVQFLQESGLIGKESTVVSLSGADLSEADLIRADLSEADLRGAGLTGADLRRAALRTADLSEANFFAADLILADLRGAYLTGVDLGEANLFRADLRGADLSEAYLSEAYLSEADLTDAKVERDQLSQTRSLEGATMPDGTKYEQQPPAEVEPDQVFFTTAQFAAAIHATPAKVRRMCRAGQVNADKRRGWWYIPADEVERFERK